MAISRLFAFFLASLWVSLSTAQTCEYQTWEWNTLKKKSENHRRVKKSYHSLAKEEKDPSSPCTVCEVDQVTLSLKGIPSFRICRHFADELKTLLEKTISQGFPIRTIVGYRVGRSRGKVDSKGLRTQFSNHSFGSAFDINSEHNGLYGNCVNFGPNCKLRRGGKWNSENPLSITKQSLPYQLLTRANWKWGGEIAGQQKDFMHFSRTGY